MGVTVSENVNFCVCRTTLLSIEGGKTYYTMKLEVSSLTILESVYEKDGIGGGVPASAFTPFLPAALGYRIANDTDPLRRWYTPSGPVSSGGLVQGRAITATFDTEPEFESNPYGNPPYSGPGTPPPGGNPDGPGGSPSPGDPDQPPPYELPPVDVPDNGLAPLTLDCCSAFNRQLLPGTVVAVYLQLEGQEYYYQTTNVEVDVEANTVTFDVMQGAQYAYATFSDDALPCVDYALDVPVRVDLRERVASRQVETGVSVTYLPNHSIRRDIGEKQQINDMLNPSEVLYDYWVADKELSGGLVTYTGETMLGRLASFYPTKTIREPGPLTGREAIDLMLSRWASDDETLITTQGGISSVRVAPWLEYEPVPEMLIQSAGGILNPTMVGISLEQGDPAKGETLTSAYDWLKSALGAFEGYVLRVNQAGRLEIVPPYWAGEGVARLLSIPFATHYRLETPDYRLEIPWQYDTAQLNLSIYTVDTLGVDPVAEPPNTITTVTLGSRYFDAGLVITLEDVDGVQSLVIDQAAGGSPSIYYAVYGTISAPGGAAEPVKRLELEDIRLEQSRRLDLDSVFWAARAVSRAVVFGGGVDASFPPSFYDVEHGNRYRAGVDRQGDSLGDLAGKPLVFNDEPHDTLLGDAPVDRERVTSLWRLPDNVLVDTSKTVAVNVVVDAVWWQAGDLEPYGETLGDSDPNFTHAPAGGDWAHDYNNPPEGAFPFTYPELQLPLNGAPIRYRVRVDKRRNVFRPYGVIDCDITLAWDAGSNAIRVEAPVQYLWSITGHANPWIMSFRWLLNADPVVLGEDAGEESGSFGATGSASLPGLDESREKYAGRPIKLIDTTPFNFDAATLSSIAEHFVLQHYRPAELLTLELANRWRLRPDDVGRLVELPSGAKGELLERVYSESHSPGASIASTHVELRLPPALNPGLTWGQSGGLEDFGRSLYDDVYGEAVYGVGLITDAVTPVTSLPPATPGTPSPTPTPQTFDVILRPSMTTSQVQGALSLAANAGNRIIGLEPGVYPLPASGMYSWPGGTASQQAQYICTDPGGFAEFDWDDRAGDGITVQSHTVFQGVRSKNAGGRGFAVFGKQNVRLSRVHAEYNGHCGVQIYEGAGSIIVEDSLANHNGQTSEGDGDGFQALDTNGGVTFRRNVAAFNTDDGYDCYRSPDVLLEDCYAYGNGVGAGDGNGFKPGNRNTLRRCIALPNTKRSVENQGDDSPTVAQLFDECVFIGNGSYENLSIIGSGHTLRNSAGYGGSTSTAGLATASNNAGNLPGAVTGASASDFIKATAPAGAEFYSSLKASGYGVMTTALRNRLGLKLEKASPEGYTEAFLDDLYYLRSAAALASIPSYHVFRTTHGAPLSVGPQANNSSVAAMKARGGYVTIPSGATLSSFNSYPSGTNFLLAANGRWNDQTWTISSGKRFNIYGDGDNCVMDNVYLNAQSAGACKFVNFEMGNLAVDQEMLRTSGGDYLENMYLHHAWVCTGFGDGTTAYACHITDGRKYLFSVVNGDPKSIRWCIFERGNTDEATAEDEGATKINKSTGTVFEFCGWLHNVTFSWWTDYQNSQNVVQLCLFYRNKRGPFIEHGGSDIGSPNAISKLNKVRLCLIMDANDRAAQYATWVSDVDGLFEWCKIVLINNDSNVWRLRFNSRSNGFAINRLEMSNCWIDVRALTPNFANITGTIVNIFEDASWNKTVTDYLTFANNIVRLRAGSSSLDYFHIRTRDGNNEQLTPAEFEASYGTNNTYEYL